MPKYYCDYCDTYLTHDSPSVRKTHNGGRKHKEAVRLYYTKWIEEQAQSFIDQTYKAQIGNSMPPFYMGGPMGGVAIPPPGQMSMVPPPGMMGGPPGGMLPPGPGGPGGPMGPGGPPVPPNPGPAFHGSQYPGGPVPMSGPPGPGRGKMHGARQEGPRHLGRMYRGNEDSAD